MSKNTASVVYWLSILTPDGPMGSTIKLDLDLDDLCKDGDSVDRAYANALDEILVDAARRLRRPEVNKEEEKRLRALLAENLRAYKEPGDAD